MLGPYAGQGQTPPPIVAERVFCVNSTASYKIGVAIVVWTAHCFLKTSWPLIPFPETSFCQRCWRLSGLVQIMLSLSISDQNLTNFFSCLKDSTVNLITLVCFFLCSVATFLWLAPLSYVSFRLRTRFEPNSLTTVKNQDTHPSLCITNLSTYLLSIFVSRTIDCLCAPIKPEIPHDVVLFLVQIMFINDPI